MNTSKRVPGGLFQPQKLEISPNFSNLKIIEDDNVNSIMGRNIAKGTNPKIIPDTELPSISVIPDPGLCVKTKNMEGIKVFVNVCKIEAIPPAKPITEEALQSIIAAEDYNSDFQIPMSLGAPRKEQDKSGKDCFACDVAVNAVWYDQTMVDSLTFTTFLVSLAMEGLCDKYGDSCNLDRQNWSILRNKRYMGKLQRHTIQQRAKLNKIQELDHSSSTSADQMKPLKSKTLITPMKETPDLVLVKTGLESEDSLKLRATIALPKILNKHQISLEIGEDRLVLHSEFYFLDIFLPETINPDDLIATFHRDKHELVIEMVIKK